MWQLVASVVVYALAARWTFLNKNDVLMYALLGNLLYSLSMMASKWQLGG